MFTWRGGIVQRKAVSITASLHRSHYRCYWLFSAATDTSIHISFLIALLLSIILNPFVALMQKGQTAARTGCFFVILTAIVIAVGFLILVVSELIQGTAYLAEHVPSYFQQLMHIFRNLLDKHLLPLYEKFSSFFHSLSSDQQTRIHEHANHLINQWANNATAVLQNVLMQIPGTLAQLPGYAAIFFLLLWLLSL